ncbi:hypothetical protein [Paraflavitalea speifideaquila]|uniref:hypothetical protein n=1 Tax=Paraflavitalea speifideaquila TaxID=3076558 RepID=UPI0028E96F03|nr:hypothetical protein [Paraflavitalea speifideiaquila]
MQQNYKSKQIIFLFLLIGIGLSLQAQEGNNNSINITTTAVPFLRISPDARSGGMGM